MPVGSGKAKATPKKTGATSASASKSRERTYNRKKHESYNIYIYKVLKQVHPEVGVSKRAMLVLNSFVTDVFERICEEASRLCHYNKKQTLGKFFVFILFFFVCVFFSFFFREFHA